MKRAISLLLALVLCVGLLSALGSASAASLEERQKIVVATALAYYEKGQSLQYDGNTICNDIARKYGGKTRSTNQEAPEYATPNETLYSVCSDFAHQVYYEAFRYQLGGSAGACWTGGLAATKESSKTHVYKFVVESGKDVKEAITELVAAAQPGDVITAISKNDAGHTMIFVGDVKGDGKTYLAHCYGAGISAKNRTDTREIPVGAERDNRYKYKSYSDAKGGAIRLSEAEPFMQKTYGKPGGYKIINCIRPLMVCTEEKYPATAAANYRVTHPQLCIDRLLEGKTRFCSAYTGETVKLSLKLSNGSTQDYTVPVTEKTPAGAKLKTPISGAKVDGETQTIDVALKAGESKTFTCEYEITAARGATVVFGNGSVGDIPSNSIPITVGGKKLTADDQAKLAAVAEGKFDALAGATNATLGDLVYQKVLGLNVQLPTVEQVIKNMVEPKTLGDKTTNVFKEKSAIAAADQLAYATLVPMFHGGKNIWNEWGHDCCRDPKDIHVEPGDVIVRTNDITACTADSTLVYLGGGKYVTVDGETLAIKEEPELVQSIPFRAFYALRPTLVYDDIHNGSASVQAGSGLAFTDVKESDWYYTYVKDLVADGTVNGMTATTFAPNGTLTYGQALKLITLGVGEKSLPSAAVTGQAAI